MRQRPDTIKHFFHILCALSFTVPNSSLNSPFPGGAQVSDVDSAKKKDAENVPEIVFLEGLSNNLALKESFMQFYVLNRMSVI
jgi:hypothetical protein